MRKRSLGALACGLVLAMPGGLVTLEARAESLTPEESRWLDPRMSDGERAILDATAGFAPRDFPPELAWHGSHPLSLRDMRGKIVVIQSWSRKSAAGRAAPVRAAHVLDGFSTDDVRIIALHTPEGADGVETYLERRDLGVPVVVDAKGSYCDELGVFERPVTIVVDRHGAVRYAGVSITGLPQAVERLVGEEFSSSESVPKEAPARDDRDLALGLESKPGRAPARKGDGDFPPIAGALNGANDLRGKKGPPLFAQQWLTGKPAAEGKVVVAEFWATWCGPCIKGIPHLNDLQAAFPEEVVVVGISDETSAKVKPAIKRLDMRYTVAIDQTRRMRQMIQNRGIPHALVMSPDGVVRWQGHPAKLSEQTLRQIVRASDLDAGGASGAARYRWVSATG